MADKKLFRVIKALLVSVCILLCSATAVACKSCKKNDTDVESGEFPSITFTSAAIVEIVQESLMVRQPGPQDRRHDDLVVDHR